MTIYNREDYRTALPQIEKQANATNTRLDKAQEDIQELQERDYIVEQGESGDWTYRKWASGVAECWGTHSKTLTHYTTALGGYGYNTGAIAFPTGLFNAIPKSVTYSAYIGNGFALTGSMTSSISKTSTSLFAISSAGGSQSTTWYAHVIGTWK